MKKQIKKLLTIGLVLIGSSTFAQISFSHSIGVAAYVASSASGAGILYSPRLNFMEVGNEATISFGTHLGIGGNFNSREGGSSIALDLPFMVEYNFGHASSKNANSTEWGGFGGIGYGYSVLADENTGSNSASGPVFNAGLRTNKLGGKSLGLRISYLLNTSDVSKSVFGIGAMYNIGMD